MMSTMILYETTSGRQWVLTPVACLVTEPVKDLNRHHWPQLPPRWMFTREALRNALTAKAVSRKGRLVYYTKNGDRMHANVYKSRGRDWYRLGCQQLSFDNFKILKKWALQKEK